MDEALVHRCRNGDMESFEQLVSRYQQRIFAFTFRMVMSEEEARDLAQETFIQVYRALPAFRGEARFATWLYRIAANKCLDYLRRRKNNQSVPFDTLASEPGNYRAYNPEHLYLQEEKIRRVRAIIMGLPDRYRVVLVLFHYENLTYQQIADALELPVKTVATRLYRAKLLLKERIGGEIDGMQ